MSAEGGEVRGDRLVVSDVGEDLAKDRQRTPGANRGNDPALGQQGGEPNRLEHHRLPPGVRARHEEGPDPVDQCEIEGDHHGKPVEQERVTRVVQHQRPAGVQDLGEFTVHVASVLGPRHEVIHRHAHLVSGGQLDADWSQETGQLAQHLQHRPLLLGDRGPEGVAEGDRRRGLEEQGPRAAGLVVHDALGSAPRIAPHGNDVATLAHRHRRPGRRGLGVQAAQQRLEFPDQSLARDVHLAACRSQLRARGVEQLPALLVHRFHQATLDGTRRGLGPECRNAGRLLADSVQLCGNDPRRTEGLAHRPQVRGLQKGTVAGGAAPGPPPAVGQRGR